MKRATYCLGVWSVVYFIINVVSGSERVRVNFHTESEASLNRQINQALKTEYLYVIMCNYLSRDDVALLGLTRLFRLASAAKRQQAESMMTYQNTRGGRVVFRDIGAPSSTTWSDGLSALQAALSAERDFNQSMLELYKVALKRDDAQLKHWLETTVLSEEEVWIKQLGDLVTQLQRSGPGLGEIIVRTNTFDFYTPEPNNRNTTDSQSQQ